MRQLAVAVLPFITAALLAGPVFAGPTPRFSEPPANFTCSFVAPDAIQCTWGALVDELGAATKYSVDTIANFELGNGLGAQSADFDFGTRETTITIPLSEFPADVDGDTLADTLVSVVLRVKGLAPPGKRLFNQNNAFSPTVTCVVSTATCGAP